MVGQKQQVRSWTRGERGGREEIRSVEAVFDTTPLRGDILEDAAATGYWTPYLGAELSK
jgi:hypothetical protein